jgi:predicted RNA binding protein YcfA (HicA-like mRNA interferase family)
MPPKIRELIVELELAGFIDRGGKGSHRNYGHPDYSGVVTLSGSPGDDAKPCQIKAVLVAITEMQQ